MDKHISDILEIMDNELKIYKTLHSLALEKRPVLIKGNITELERITREEEVLLLQVGRLEEQRQSLLEVLAGHFSVSPEKLTLSELIKKAAPEKRSAAEELHEEMTGVLKELSEMNRVNADLIKSSLDYINFSLNILTGEGYTPGYSEREEEKKQSTAKIFDRKI